MSNQNVELARKFMSAIDSNDWDAVRDIVTDDFVMEYPGQPPIDKEGFIQFCIAWYTGFPGLVHDIQESVCEDDRVVLRIIVRATHQGEFMGLPATGRTIAVHSAGIGYIRDGRVAKLWALPDVMGMMQQLGAIPEPATA